MARKEEIARSMEMSARGVEEKGTTASEKMAEHMRRMAESIRSFSLDRYKEQVMDTMDDVRSGVDKNVDNVKSGIQDHPFESVAIAAGTGILVGAAIALMGRHAAKKATRM